MGIFRLWQPHTDEYMFVWNSLVAMHTVAQLSDAMKARVYEHYSRIVVINRLDPFHDIALGPRHDPFWLAFTMADLGISPFLGHRTAKWFYVTNPRRARNILFDKADSESDAIGNKVIKDIQRKHGVLLDLETLRRE
jgi:hypothetical protein